mgnify:CR=1 FL=1
MGRDSQEDARHGQGEHADEQVATGEEDRPGDDDEEEETPDVEGLEAVCDDAALAPEFQDVVERLEEGRWQVRFEPELTLARLDRIGHTPLPPYIQRVSGELPADRGDYQTVYAAEPGAVAAPTAGLHFTEEILESVHSAGAELAYLTLHVGLGTFRPVAVEDVGAHRMHSEWYRITDATAVKINRALAEERRVVCVGTTTVRAVEGAIVAARGRLAAGDSSTDLFITPGFEFRATGALLTNFHLPRSTLLMMVSAFAGRERVLAAYEEAIRVGYRFYSYGDAMLIV